MLRPTYSRQHAATLCSLRQPKREGRCMCALVLIVGAVCFPASASAREGYEVRPASFKVVLPVRHRANYTASIVANEGQNVKFFFDTPSSTIEFSTTGQVRDRG